MIEIGIAVGVEVAPRRGARLDVVGEADFGRDIAKRAFVVAIEAVRPAAERDEVIEVAVVVGIGPRVGLAAGRGKQLGLDQLERWLPVRRLKNPGGNEQGRQSEGSHQGTMVRILGLLASPSNSARGASWSRPTRPAVMIARA